jgi:hypothetical protein
MNVHALSYHRYWNSSLRIRVYLIFIGLFLFVLNTTVSNDLLNCLHLNLYWICFLPPFVLLHEYTILVNDYHLIGFLFYKLLFQHECLRELNVLKVFYWDFVLALLYWFLVTICLRWIIINELFREIFGEKAEGRNLWVASLDVRFVFNVLDMFTIIFSKWLAHALSSLLHNMLFVHRLLHSIRGIDMLSIIIYRLPFF